MKVEQKSINVRDLADGYVDDNEQGARGYGGCLDIRPPYQRNFVYEGEQRDEVIRTVAKGFPLNSMYWAVCDDDKFEIIDGQQRTISLCLFVENKFSVKGLFGVEQPQIFHTLTFAEKKAILDYELTVYQCNGTDRERLDWFETINIAGERLYKQELRNAVYSGKWVTDAKGWFSSNNCQATRIGGRYLSGDRNRHAYLETAIKWASEGKIEEYMAKHQSDNDAQELWDYFQSVIDWVNKVFPKYNSVMKGIAWGDLHRAYKDDNFNADKLQVQIDKLMADVEVENNKGIYLYLLGGRKDEKHLNLRTFSESQKTTAYEKQNGKCNICKNIFPIKHMHGDHIKPWSKDGKTEPENLQMLCIPCNQSKSDN